LPAKPLGFAREGELRRRREAKIQRKEREQEYREL
jgi:hypothetical protein